MLGVRSDDVLCTALPLFHTNALNTFYQALLNGCCVRYEKRFSASGFYSALAQHRATVTYLLGAMVPMLLAQSRRHRRSWRMRRVSRSRPACRRNSMSRSRAAPAFA